MHENSHSSASPAPTSPDDGESLDGRTPVEYRGATDTYRAPIDGDADSVALAVVDVVAAVAGTDPTALPPLGEVVDPDALESLVTPAGTPSGTDDVRVAFTFDGHDVTVFGHGVVAVRPAQDASPTGNG